MLGESFDRGSLLCLGGAASELDDGLFLRRDDALEGDEEAMDDRDGLPSRRDRLSMVLTASILEEFDSVISDA